jgi:hypothetical protein
MIGDATVIEAPSRTLGVHNFYLRVQVRIVPRSEPA